MKIEDVFEDVLDVKADTLDDELGIGDIDNWDSMGHMMLISSIEEAFEIELTGDEIAEMRTVGKIKEILETKK